MNPDPVVGLDKNENLCDGTPRILDAGAFSSYNWSTGSTDRIITINTTGTYSVTVTDKNGCTGTEHVNVTTVVPSPKDFLPADTSICSYGNALVKPISRFTKYLWSTGSDEPSIIIIKAGQYWLQAQDKNGCIGTDTIHVLPKDCLAGFFMPTAFTPNFDGKNDILKPVVLGIVKKYQFQIYNRWGQLVFISTDYTKGWDGTFKSVKQDAGSYVWVCVYQFEGETQVNKKGTFMLIR
jgi:gliding motility-associated-like protein